MAQPESKPNIVFILIDDLRFNALACTGHPFAKTPNIDRIAREGATFRNAFVTTPLCSPSRATYLTGRVHSHGVRQRERGSSDALDGHRRGYHIVTAHRREVIAFGVYPGVTSVFPAQICVGATERAQNSSSAAS